MLLKQAIGAYGVYLLTAIMVWVPASVQAEMLGTRQAMQSLSNQPSDREQLISMVQRTEVQERLQAFGMSGTEALNRVNSMTDDEVASVMLQIDQLPEGQGAAGTVLAAFLIVGIVVLFLWLLKVIKIEKAAIGTPPGNSTYNPGPYVESLKDTSSPEADD